LPFKPFGLISQKENRLSESSSDVSLINATKHLENIKEEETDSILKERQNGVENKKTPKDEELGKIEANYQRVLKKEISEYTKIIEEQAHIIIQTEKKLAMEKKEKDSINAKKEELFHENLILKNKIADLLYNNRIMSSMLKKQGKNDSIGEESSQE